MWRFLNLKLLLLLFLDPLIKKLELPVFMAQQRGGELIYTGENAIHWVLHRYYYLLL